MSLAPPKPEPIDADGECPTSARPDAPIVLPPIVAASAAVLAGFFWYFGLLLPSILTAIVCVSFLMTWVDSAYVAKLRAGKTPPGWLAILERLREYLAVEPPPVV